MSSKFRVIKCIKDPNFEGTFHDDYESAEKECQELDDKETVGSTTYDIEIVENPDEPEDMTRCDFCGEKLTETELANSKLGEPLCTNCKADDDECAPSIVDKIAEGD